jgi:hypothetical protein
MVCPRRTEGWDDWVIVAEEIIDEERIIKESSIR